MEWSGWGRRGGKPFHCCCGLCHVKQGAFVLGIAELFVTVMTSAFLLNWLKEDEFEAIQLYTDNRTAGPGVTFSPFLESTLETGGRLGTALSCMWAGAIIGLFFGLFAKRPVCLLPHICLQLVTLLSSGIYLLLLAWDYFYVDLWSRGRALVWEELSARLCLSGLFLLIATAQIYIFSIILTAYRYLREERYRVSIQCGEEEQEAIQ